MKQDHHEHSDSAGASPPNGTRGKKRIRAGEALLKAAKANPQAYPAVFRMLHLEQYAKENPEFAAALRAIWERVPQGNEAIRTASAQLQPVMAAILAEYQAQVAAISAERRQVEKAEFDKLLDDICQAEVQADKEWEARFPCPRPKTIEEWERLASRAGIPADYVLQGHWTPTDVLPIVGGYFQRLQDQRSLAVHKPGPSERRSGNQKQVSHSEDFTSVCWFGNRYQFAKGQQAEAVHALWEAWEAGGHTLSELTIGEKVDSGNDHFRLIHVFRNRKRRGYHSAWGTMIQKAGKGVYRLAEPGQKLRIPQ